MRRTARAASLLALATAIVAGCRPAKHECLSGQTECGFLLCADLSTDPSHCGACGIDCGSGTCAGGVCQCEGLTRCEALNPRCRDLATDASSCGSCGSACPLANAECAAGSCRCPTGLPTECPVVNPTACANLTSDRLNCGACGNVCRLQNEICSASTSPSTCGCPATLPDRCPTASPTACVTLDADPANCGSCGNACPAGDACCARSCKDLASDGQNCGTCGHACAGTEICCSGSCKDLASDAQNCGACAIPCPTGATCTASTCVCPGATPVYCGASCCAGTACCAGGSLCQTEHTNGNGIAGLGQHFFDCNPLGTHTAASAQAAAQAWRATATLVGSLGCPDCLGWQTNDACGVWCWGTDPLGGHVNLNTISNGCFCPSTASPTWN